MDVHISTATEADMAEILGLQRLAFRQEAELYNDFGIAPLTQTLEELREEAGSMVLLKAVYDGRIVGSVRAAGRRGTCHIGRLIVHPDCQNRGVGKMLMSSVEERFAGFKYELFTGDRSEKNLAFYEKLGYRRFDTRIVKDNLKFVYFEKNAAGTRLADGGSITAYKKFAVYYDNYVAGFEEDLPLYLSYAKDGMRVLEAGCGTGRVLKPLLEAGCRVTGVDISPEMLSIAKERLADYINDGRLRLLEHNLCKAPVQGSFEAAFVTFYTFNYLIGLSDRAGFIQNIYSLLEPGGLIIMDLFYPQSLSEPGLEDRWTEKPLPMDGYSVKLLDRRRMNGGIEERTQRYVRGDRVDEITTRRIFLTKPHLGELLSGAGFRNVRFADGYDVKGLHRLGDGEGESSGFVVVAEKQRAPRGMEKADAEIVMTDSGNEDFARLILLLDEDLDERYGELQKKYNLLNKVDLIKDAIVVYKFGEPVACGAFKEYDSRTVEVKRVFVKKGYRGLGISRLVMSQLEETAAGRGYQYVVLETGIKQHEAISLYKKLGYEPIPNYGPYAGNPNSVCMKKSLPVG